MEERAVMEETGDPRANRIVPLLQEFVRKRDVTTDDWFDLEAAIVDIFLEDVPPLEGEQDEERHLELEWTLTDLLEKKLKKRNTVGQHRALAMQVLKNLEDRFEQGPPWDR